MNITNKQQRNTHIVGYTELYKRIRWQKQDRDEREVINPTITLKERPHS